MKVKATQKGYYDHRRIEEGDVFVLKTIEGHKQTKEGKLVKHTFTPEEQFSDRWMEKVEVAEEYERKPRASKKREEPEMMADDEVI